MREAIASAKGFDEAIDKACAELGLPREAVEVEVLEAGKKGLFGKPCKVRVYVEEAETKTKKEEKKIEKKAPEKAESPVAEDKASEEEVEVEISPDEATAQKIETAISYLKSIIRELGLDDIAVTHKYTKSGLKISVDGESVGVIIGKRGETLDAIQTLTSLAANKKDEGYLRVSVNSGDYREKRRKTLEELAIKVAKNVASSGRKHTFEPMSAYERRIIHSAAATVEGVTSKSFGEEPERKVVILSDNPRAQRSSGGKRGGRGYQKSSSPKREASPVSAGNHSDDSAYFSLLDEFE